MKTNIDPVNVFHSGGITKSSFLIEKGTKANDSVIFEKRGFGIFQKSVRSIFTIPYIE